jgi:hypothetical protein
LPNTNKGDPVFAIVSILLGRPRTPESTSSRLLDQSKAREDLVSRLCTLSFLLDAACLALVPLSEVTLQEAAPMAATGFMSTCRIVCFHDLIL